jgi:hypothetical protein
MNSAPKNCFEKWSGTHQREISRDVRAGEDEVLATEPDADDRGDDIARAAASSMARARRR